jgi:2-methylisocitrate lyase-like PEP mutase family enzyme
MHPGKKLRKALAGKGLITAPGVYDMISAKIADAIGFTTLYMTGFGVSATLGMPDAGLASYTEMVERVAQICQGTSTPVICDGDTGFGGLLNVERTIRGYETAGAAGIQIEDQVFPKKCGHTPGRRAIMLLLVLAATLPVVIAILARPAMYNGIRHFLFVVPTLAFLLLLVDSLVNKDLSADHPFVEIDQVSH